MIFSDNARHTTLSTGISGGATSLVLADATGWPSPTGDQTSRVIVDYGDQALVEVGSYTSRSGNTLSGVTGIDSGHLAGVEVRHGFGSEDMQKALGFSGCFVALSETQEVPDYNTEISGYLVPFDTSIFDTDNYWDPAHPDGPHYFTLPFSGFYWATIHLHLWQSSVTPTGSYAYVDFHEAGPFPDTIQTTSETDTPLPKHLTLTHQFQAEAGQEIDIKLNHNTTGGVYLRGKTGVLGAGRWTTFAQFRFLGE